MRSRSGVALFWGGIVAVVVFIAVFSARDTNTDALDPRSVAPDGARGLVELAERFGADVEVVIDLPDAGHDVAVLLRDPYGFADRERLEAWVRSGGRLLVADPESPLTPRPVVESSAPGGSESTPCVVEALGSVASLSGVTAAYAEGRGLRCFDGAVAVTPLGNGVIVALGGAEPLLNERLDEADNAVFAAAVLVPVEGTRVAFVDPATVLGEASESLIDLVADPVWLLLFQVVVAFVLYAWWRAYRLGRPVPEPLPVELAGSELTAARGRLMAAMHHPLDPPVPNLEKPALPHPSESQISSGSINDSRSTP